jgi:hypothetical protein
MVETALKLVPHNRRSPDDQQGDAQSQGGQYPACSALVHDHLS